METSILNKSPVRGEWLPETHNLLKKENGFMQTLQFIISNVGLFRCFHHATERFWCISLSLHIQHFFDFSFKLRCCSFVKW